MPLLYYAMHLKTLRAFIYTHISYYTYYYLSMSVCICFCLTDQDKNWYIMYHCSYIDLVYHFVLFIRHFCFIYNFYCMCTIVIQYLFTNLCNYAFFCIACLFWMIAFLFIFLFIDKMTWATNYKPTKRDTRMHKTNTLDMLIVSLNDFKLFN